MRGTATALALTLALPSAVPAQMATWERQVRDRIAAVLHDTMPARAGGIVRVGNLNADEADTVAIELDTGNTYEFLAVCDDDCGGLRLVLASHQGNEFASTRPDENLPVLRFTPRRVAAYRLRVVMTACRLNPCWYAVGLRQTAPAGSP